MFSVVWLIVVMVFDFFKFYSKINFVNLLLFVVSNKNFIMVICGIDNNV